MELILEIIGGVIVMLNIYLIIKVIKLKRNWKKILDINNIQSDINNYLMNIMEKNLEDQISNFTNNDNRLGDVLGAINLIIDIVDETDSNGIKKKISEIELNTVKELNVDDVLNKINIEGYENLTVEEINFLKGDK